jgi:DNA-binding MarR family transcriptional regulator
MAPPQPEIRPDAQVFDEIGMIEHLARTVITRYLPIGLTYPQYEALGHLVRRGDDVTPAELANALQMTPGAITNTLQRMEATRLVSVEADPSDGRKKRVRLTAEGRQAFAQSMAAIRPKMDMLREGFTQQEFRDALPFLKALRIWMSELP